MQLSSSSLPIGVLSSVLGKLPALVEKQCNNKFKGVNEEILSMKTELQSMNALLLKLADIDDLDVQIKEWRNQIRELSYDIEDCIDNFIHRIDGGSSRVHKGFFQKSIHKLRTLGARNEIADQILKLKARVDNASERQKRYNFNGAISSSIDVVPLDPRLPALFAEADALVGIDEPTEALINWLTRGGEKLESRLSVVSLVGLGGLGKTTLARQVYNKIGGQFDCQAFVSISQKPVSIQYDGRVDACRVHDVIFDLIISKSAEENFITVFGYQNHALGPQHKIRRLVDYHSPEEIMVPSNMNVLNVRSLTTYGSTENVLPLSDFQALRTISMECNDQLENHHLNGIGRLFRLKYPRVL